MRARCIQAVSQAIGRQLTQQEAKDIENRILTTMRYEARRDPATWQAMTGQQRLQAAAQLAAQQLVDEAMLKKRRVAMTIQAHDRIENFLIDAKARGMDGLEALERTLVFRSDGKSNTMSAESVGNAVRANALRQLLDTFDAVDPKFWGLWEDAEGVKLLTKAIFREQTGSPEADAGAAAWHTVAEQLRNQFNELGGKIGKLENWSIPQHHSQVKVAAAGADKWVQDITPLLDRSAYVNPDGSLMNAQEMEAFLRNAYLSIATGGINKLEPGGPQGSGMLANRNAESRAIHFLDADAYLKYQQTYGENSLWGVIVGHVEHIAKQLGMLEVYGPNPDHTFRLMLDKQMQEAALLDPGKAASVQESARRLQSLYEFTTGATQPVVNQTLATSFDTLRNWLVASRLGSAVITAMTDEATVHLTAQLNNLPEMQLARNELAALNPLNKTEENLALRAGLGLDTMIGHLNRWGQDSLGPTWSNKMASTVMRLSGLEALDGARRRAFGATMMHALGEMVGKYADLAGLDPVDNRLLLAKGITDTDWAVWKLAQLEDWHAGNKVLTPESVMRITDSDLAPIVLRRTMELQTELNQKLADIQSSPLSAAEKQAASDDWMNIYNGKIVGLPQRIRLDAVQRLLGVVLEETDMAIIRPGMADRYLTGGNMVRGTWKGELTRSFFQFKAFPLAMISRHFMRGVGMPTVGGKAAYIASLIAATTVLGALSQSVNDLLSGKDIRNYNPFEGEHGARNWMAAFLKGGSLGIYGDFLFSGVNQSSNTGPLAALMGPGAGLVEEAFGLTQGNLIQMAKGEETNFGAELTRFIKGNTPGASLWYAKAALDHIIFQQMQEYFSPGYLSKMKRRTEREFGQTWWWEPGTGIEGMRAPDFERAVGGP